MKISIIKYNGGNVQSVVFALNRLGVEPILTNDAEVLATSDKIIFPGVGEAAACMQSLKETGLDTIIPTLKTPLLGICVGLQLLCNYSEEGNTKGMGIFDVAVRKFKTNTNLKVPQMGWNTVSDLKTDLFKNIPEQSYVYYVHSFAAEIGKNTIAQTDYTLPYSAALQKDNFYAVQFHTEKSSLVGSTILENFLRLS
jgi:imidazole glycerol-phosphate synthase subunit HisH